MQFDKKCALEVKYRLTATVLDSTGEEVEMTHESESPDIIREKLSEYTSRITKEYYLPEIKF